MKSAKIHVLSDEIINKIAAGEVIERPASAVKELIENAIDAKATRIQIQIEEGGKKKILVSDNGIGMGKDDLNLCYKRHTTSKLLSAEDLFHLHTNGFRGEAVASIAAVSRMTITSANEDGESNRIVLSGGNIVKEMEYASNRGTTFLIEDLFFNTPVRKTFLNSETSETSKILDIIIKIAIAHPEIRFDYKVHDKSVFIGVPGELRNRIAETIGSGIAKKLLKVDFNEAGINVKGFISPTTETNGKRYHQYLFIRNRPIENKAISKAITQIYEPYGTSCKPVTILFLDMPDMDFDVNVHPAKREVRFANQSLVFHVVSHAIRETLKKDLEQNSSFIDLSNIELEPKNEQSRTFEKSYPKLNPTTSIAYIKDNQTQFNFDKKRNLIPDKDEVQDLFSQPESGKIISLEKEHVNDSQKKVESPSWTPPTLLQIANTYIACEDSDGLLIIDQHNAHMRILYEQALDSLNNGLAIDSQELLFPELIDFSKQEKELFTSVEQSLQKLGFHIESFGGDTYQVRSIPYHLPLSRITSTIHEFFESCIISNESDMLKIQDSIAKAWAKTNAFKSGDKLKLEEMANLIEKLMITKEPLSSPYKTPTLMRITRQELSKKFRR